MPKGKNLRRHPRRRTTGMTLMCYASRPSGGDHRPSQNIGEAIVDISPSGCRLQVSQRVDAGMPLTVELRDAATQEVFRARGRVRWVRPCASQEREAWHVGVQFEEIVASYAGRQKFVFGMTPLGPPPAGEEPGTARAPRFRPEDCRIEMFRRGLLARVGLRRNVAKEIVDLSRTGARVLSTEKLGRGTRVGFLLHLAKFADSLETDAEVIWEKPFDSARGKPGKGDVFCAGLKFDAMPPEKRKLLDNMTSWFTSYQARYRQEHRS